MAVVIKIDFDLNKALVPLKAVAPEKWQGILQSAANETGFYVLNKYKQQMPHYIDRPVPYTLNSMFLKKATKTNPEATVQWKEWSGTGAVPAGKYLQPEVFGGNRSQKRFEKALARSGLLPEGWVAVPTKDAPKDNFGNVPGGYITKILSYLKANPDAQQNRQIQRLRKKRTVSFIREFAKAALNKDKILAREERARKRGQKFFAVIRGRDNNPLPSGIYERANLTLGSAIKKVFSFVPAASYRVSFPFAEIGDQAARAKFPEKLDEAIQKALSKI